MGLLGETKVDFIPVTLGRKRKYKKSVTVYTRSVTINRVKFADENGSLRRLLRIISRYNSKKKSLSFYQLTPKTLDKLLKAKLVTLSKDGQVICTPTFRKLSNRILSYLEKS